MCVCMCVCGPVTTGSKPGHINFTPLQAGCSSPLAGAGQWKADGARMQAIWGWGRGCIPPSQNQEAPCLQPPIGVGPEADTITNVL